MANISIFAGNLNPGLSYLNTTVSKMIKFRAVKPSLSKKLFDTSEMTVLCINKISLKYVVC